MAERAEVAYHRPRLLLLPLLPLAQGTQRGQWRVARVLVSQGWLSPFAPPAPQRPDEVSHTGSSAQRRQPGARTP